MQFKIVVSDRDFTVLEEIQDIVSNLSWEYNRIGGCGSFSFDVPIKFCKELTLGGNFNIKIYRRNPSTKAFDLWYQGRIENKIHNVKGEDETISVQGMGYLSTLSDIYVDRDYTNTEISVIVKSILDNDIVPNTNISYSALDIEATSFTPDSLSFNTDALSALQTLADITGSREWGVDADRNFYFKARSSSVGFRYPIGTKILNFSIDNSSKEIVNRVIVTGGDVGGSPFTATYNDTSSQLKWKRRDKAVQNSSILTSQVASQFADSIFAEFNDIVRRGRVELLEERQVESTVPIPLFQIIPKPVLYNQMKYGTFLYSGLVSYQVNRVNYVVDNFGNLKISMQVGQLRPSVAENISQLAYQIEQLRNNNL